MGMIAALSTTQFFYPMEIITQGGAIATVSLIISLSIAFFISDSKYWNEWSSSTLDTCSKSLLITFAAIVTFKVLLIL